MAKVIPNKYHPLMQGLFISRMSDALDSLGMRLEDVLIHVNPTGKDIFLRFHLKVVQTSLTGSIDVESTVKGLIEKLTMEANESIGRVYGVTFLIDGIDVEQDLPRKYGIPRDKSKLVLNVPPDLEESVRRIGKGLIISLRDWGIPVVSLALNVDTTTPNRIGLVVKLEKPLDKAEKESLVKALREKLSGYVKLLIKKPMEISVRVLDPSDKVVAKVMKKAKLAEKEVEAIIGNEDVRAIMKALGKL
ncbi:hypothetical protein A0127_01035 [Thermococcus peptonophilus]|uniref:Uncharacterized protein n=1 Tax=Thermococcus peptonophilus TaxID=53952 RepID=A0A142CSV5_9EURY|nr:hypothetical protein A0127_01035 [Thermococcus peptonophilus]